jgi:drug/metabolite transporter (DMT)-like permease
MPFALAQLALSMSLVGANVIVGKLLAAALPVPVILFCRCITGTLLLGPLAFADRRQAISARMFGVSLLQALAGVLGYNSFLLAGLRHTGALQAGLVLATLPAVAALAAALLLRERLTRRRVAGIALAAAGLAALAASRAGSGGDAPVSWLGDGLVLLAVCSEAAYMLLTRVMAVRLPPLRATFWFQVSGALLTAPLALPLLRAQAATLARPQVAALLLLNAATASVLCNLLWFSGMRRAPANLAAVMGVFLPGTAAALAVLVLGERLTPALVAALAVMLASILVATWPARRGPEAPVQPI